MNMDGDLTFGNMNNGEGSNKDNLRFNNQDNSLRRKFDNRKGKGKGLRFNNQNNNLRREFGNHKDKSKDLRFSNQNTLSLKENPEVGSIEVEKAGRIRGRGDTTIRSGDIWQSLLLGEHLDRGKKGKGQFVTLRPLKRARGTFMRSVLCRIPGLAANHPYY
jgi:hypothetical protein